MRQKGKKKKSPFFSWFSEEPAQEGETRSPKDEWMMEDDDMSPTHTGARRMPQWDDSDEDGSEEWQAFTTNGSGAINEAHEKLPWEDDAGLPVSSANKTGSIENAGGLQLRWNLGMNWIEADEFESDEEFSSLESPGSLPDGPAIETGESHDEAAVPPGASPRPPAVKPYQLPSFSLLAKPSGGSGESGDVPDANDSRRKLEATLESFGVRAKVLDVCGACGHAI